VSLSLPLVLSAGSDGRLPHFATAVGVDPGHPSNAARTARLEHGLRGAFRAWIPSNGSGDPSRGTPGGATPRGCPHLLAVADGVHRNIFRHVGRGKTGPDRELVQLPGLRGRTAGGPRSRMQGWSVGGGARVPAVGTGSSASSWSWRVPGNHPRKKTRC